MRTSESGEGIQVGEGIVGGLVFGGVGRQLAQVLGRHGAGDQICGGDDSGCGPIFRKTPVDVTTFMTYSRPRTYAGCDCLVSANTELNYEETYMQHKNQTCRTSSLCTAYAMLASTFP